jgi:hypothetical protein
LRAHTNRNPSRAAAVFHLSRGAIESALTRLPPNIAHSATPVARVNHMPLWMNAKSVENPWRGAKKKKGAASTRPCKT